MEHKARLRYHDMTVLIGHMISRPLRKIKKRLLSRASGLPIGRPRWPKPGKETGSYINRYKYFIIFLLFEEIAHVDAGKTLRQRNVRRKIRGTYQRIEIERKKGGVQVSISGGGLLSICAKWYKQKDREMLKTKSMIQRRTARARQFRFVFGRTHEGGRAPSLV